MPIERTFSVCWIFVTFVLLVSFASCAVLEEWSSNPDGSGPWVVGVQNNAGNRPNQNGNISVPAPTASDPDNLTGQVGATTVINSMMSTITPPPAAMLSTCIPRNCTANASSVSIFYWPSESQNTACLSTLIDLPKNTLPPGLTPVSPSVYAIVVSFTASNGCSQVGLAFDTFTASFAPDELSTVIWAPGETATNSFADAPCGPPGWDGNGKPYQPWFEPPHAFFEQMGGPGYAGYAGCGFINWKDPSYTLVNDDGPINGPNLPPKAKPRRHKRAEIEARTHTTMGVHSVDNGPINGPNPPQHRRAAAAAQGLPPAPAKTPDPA